MAIDKITKDLAVIKSNGTFTGTFTASISGDVTISYGDGNTEISNSPSHTYSNTPPYLVNLKDFDEDTITGITISGSCDIVSVGAEIYKNLTTLDMKGASVKRSNLEDLLVGLDESGKSNGTLDISNHTLDSNHSAAATTAYDNLIAKGWTITGFTWSPEDITTFGWYDASDLSTIAEDDAMGQVSQLDDKSGNGNHIEQTVSVQQPTTGVETIGGLNALGLDGIDDYLEKSTTDSFADGFTIVALFYQNSASVGNRVFGVRSASQNKQAFAFDTDNSLRYDGANSAGNLVTPTVGEHFRIATKSADADTQTDYVDGVLNISDTADLNDSTSVKINMGNIHTAYDREFDGKIGECIVIEGVVDTSTREKIEGYLAHKWGLTANLPVSHPYKSLAP